MTLVRMSLAEVDALVGANLRRLREDASLTVAALAARTRIDPDRLAAAEDGAAHLTCDELVDVMARLHVGFDAFFRAPMVLQ